MTSPALQIDGLVVAHTAGRHAVPVVRGVDLRLARGRTLALVGESGCGKTTLLQAVLGLIPPLAGRVWVAGRDLAALSEEERRRARRDMGAIFQDPWGSLDPTLPAWRIVAAPLDAHGIGPRSERRAQAETLLSRVGLAPRLSLARPDAMSGGQRQRVAIARAIATRPALIVADEPLSALDVTQQGAILELLAEMRREMDLALFIVSHDLTLVEGIAHETAVMYAGRIVERGPTARVIGHPRHPYTRALLAARLHPDPSLRRVLPRLAGEPPDFASLPPGCPYHPRCAEVMDRCRIETPTWDEEAGAECFRTAL